MLKSYKTEIKPTEEQKQIINRTIGTCRFVYNFYLSHNRELYEKDKKFMTAKAFSVWLNNEFIPENPEYAWIKNVSSKSVKKSMENACSAYTRFFKHQKNFPRFKKKGKSDVKMYFVKTDSKAVIYCEKHRIKIPTLGWVRLKEKGYIPTTKSGKTIRSGTVSCKAGRYYVSVLVDEQNMEKPELNDFGIGIDLGIKELAVVSNGKVFHNINKTKNIKKLEKELKRERRSLSRKYESLKKRRKDEKGEATRQNIQIQKLKVQKLHYRLECARNDYINKTINEIVKTKPSYIVIEDLNISGMMKNRHLSKAVASQKLYEFRMKLMAKCKNLGIELRIADRWYPSSRMCNCCKAVKKNLKLSDRTYICDVCGHKEDRDLNASRNLRDANDYKIA